MARGWRSNGYHLANLCHLAFRCQSHNSQLELLFLRSNLPSSKGNALLCKDTVYLRLKYIRGICRRDTAWRDAVAQAARAFASALNCARWDYGRCPLWCSNRRRWIVPAMSMDFHKVNVGGRWCRGQAGPSEFSSRNRRAESRNRDRSAFAAPRESSRLRRAYATTSAYAARTDDEDAHRRVSAGTGGRLSRASIFSC